MTANGTPQIDARQLIALRKRTFTAAGKALKSMLDEAVEHQAAMEAGNVPPPDGLRRAADKYVDLLHTLWLADSVLTPQILEVMAGEPYGTAVVDRSALALFTEVLRDSGLLPAEIDPDSPLGQLIGAAGTGPVS
jgi:hypothetical protein